jgi:hypothetical protein
MHNTKGDKTYANIQAAMPLPKDAPKLEPFNTPIFFEVGSGPIPEALPEWVKEKISSCLELSGDRLPADAADRLNDAPAGEDDIPF